MPAKPRKSRLKAIAVRRASKCHGSWPFARYSRCQAAASSGVENGHSGW
ncbi:hypothetical protein ACFQQB_63950 [Nonomuraea rubra]